MPRTDLTKTTAKGPYGDYSAANSADVTMTAADAVNKNQFTATRRDLVIAHNTGVGAATVTITSVADPFGRTKDISAYSVGAGEIAAFGPFETLGWQQSDGKIYLEASSADVKFGIIALPG